MTAPTHRQCDAAPDPLAPAKLGPVTLRKRVSKAATFEGMTPKGLVTDKLIDFHRRPAAGGVGMTTVAYCAVAPDGRSAPGQIMWQDEALPGLRKLTDAIHAEGAAVSAQIGHAGPVAPPKLIGTRALAPSRAMREGFQFVAVARELLRDPTMVHRIATEPQQPSLCIHCNKCTTAIYGGTHCVLVSPESLLASTPSLPVSAVASGQ